MSARFIPNRDAAAVEAGMSVKEVDALPRVVFQTIEDEKGTSETCAICLEDYIAGDLLRLLPCQHGTLASSPPSTNHRLSHFCKVDSPQDSQQSLRP